MLGMTGSRIVYNIESQRIWEALREFWADAEQMWAGEYMHVERNNHCKHSPLDVWAYSLCMTDFPWVVVVAVEHAGYVLE